MRDRARHRAVIFDVIDDTLVRTVAFPFSEREGYIHRCTRKVYEDVAYAIQERVKDGVTLDSLVEGLVAPRPASVTSSTRARWARRCAMGCGNAGRPSRSSVVCAANTGATPRCA